MVNKTVYLAGPIDGITFEKGNDWRELFIKYLKNCGITAISPQRHKEYLKQIGDEMNFAEQEKFCTQSPLSTSRAILSRDKFDTLNCDVLVANFLGATRASLGTAMEIAWAHLRHIPIIAIIDHNDKWHSNHPMLKECYNFVVNELDEAVKLVKAILKDY